MQFLISLCSLVNLQNFSLLFYFRFVIVVLFLFSLWSYQTKPKNVSEGVLNLNTVFEHWEVHNRAERAGAFGVR